MIVLLIVIFTTGICAGLIAGGIPLYVNGTAAVNAQEAEAVFTREQAGDFISPTAGTRWFWSFTPI